MSAEQVALIPQCAECAYLDTDSVLVFYCPECAEREFGEWR